MICPKCGKTKTADIDIAEIEKKGMCDSCDRNELAAYMRVHMNPRDDHQKYCEWERWRG